MRWISFGTLCWVIWPVYQVLRGPGFSLKESFSIESDYLDELVPAIEEEINRRLDLLGIDPISIDPSSEMKANFGYRNFRYCIGIGILL